MPAGLASAMLAERKRGLRFIEKFRSSADVIKNGGSATDVTFDPHTGATFNGTSSKIDYSEKFSLTGDLTLLLRVKLGTLTGANTTIACFYTAGRVNDFRIGYNPAGELFAYYDNTQYSTGLTLTSYVGQWIWLGLRWNGTNLQVFINGSSIYSTAPAAMTRTGYTFHVGYLKTIGQYCPMECDKAYFYNDALTDQEILDYANDETFSYMRAASLILPMLNRDQEQLLSNGNFKQGSTDWTEIPNGGTISWDANAGQVTITQGPVSEYDKIYQQIDGLEVGKTYRLRVYVVDATGVSIARIGVGAGVPGVGEYNYSMMPGGIYISSPANGWAESLFTATATTGYFVISNTAAATKFITFSTAVIEELETLDRSGNGNDAVFGDGATLATMPTKLTNNKGYEGDGANKWLALDKEYQAILGEPHTISMLLKWYGTFPGAMSVQYFYDFRPERAISGYIENATKLLRFYIGDSGGTKQILVPIVENTLCHAAVSWDGITFSCYINGIYYSGIACGQPISLSGSEKNAVIGAKGGLADHNFNGEMSAFALIPFALTPLQIHDLHQKSLIKLNEAYP